MDDLRTLVRDEMARAGSPSYSFNDLGRRRDRKRRNQRIAAGAVGIAVFAAAVWIVTSGLSFDRSQTPAIPGPAETGPTFTIAPKDTAGLVGLPPSGAVPSTPEESKYVLAMWGPRNGWVILYTDGRVIWSPDGGAIYEMRLSPAGVDLFRSAPVSVKGEVFDWVLYQCPGAACVSPLPANAWEDAEIRAWVPSKYAICYLGPRDYIEPSRVVGLLPPPAQALLGGKETKTHPDPGVPDATTQKGYARPPVECSEVTTEQARGLDEILDDAGFEGNAEAGYRFVGPDGDWVQIGFQPILPHGTWVAWDTSEARRQE
jgi:hypothetical protein